jgi:hypothetical protein
VQEHIQERKELYHVLLWGQFSMARKEEKSSLQLGMRTRILWAGVDALQNFSVLWTPCT